jgi:dTDP-4-dehydrorhamnose 3,5-epimerase-like enzyme
MKWVSSFRLFGDVDVDAFDANVGIQWPEGEKVLSEKDKEGFSLGDLSDLFF